MFVLPDCQRQKDCDPCHKKLQIMDLLPVIGFILLRGRCRYCHAKIPTIYPFVEILTAVILLSLYLHYDFSLEFIIYAYLSCSLIVLSFIDYKHFILPDVITLPSIVLGLLVSIFTPFLSFKASVIGIIFGGGSLYLMGWVYQLLTKREGMGGGDIKLMAMLGAFLGFQAVFFILFVSCLLESLWGATSLLFKKSTRLTPIPFGPFISVATFIYIFFGSFLISSYQDLFFY